MSITSPISFPTNIYLTPITTPLPYPTKPVPPKPQTNPLFAKDDWFSQLVTDNFHQDPSRTLKIAEIKPLIKEWIAHLQQLPQEEKSQALHKALDSLLTHPTRTIEQIKIGVAFLEKVLLSRRISSLSSQKFYCRIVRTNHNHVLTLSGLKKYIRLQNPAIALHKLSAQFLINWPPSSVKTKLLSNSHTWILLEHTPSFHKTLVIASLQEKSIYILDSIGLEPRLTRCENKQQRQRAHLYVLTHKIAEIIPIEQIKWIDRPRQKSAVGCDAFIVHDLTKAQRLFTHNIPLFTPTGEGACYEANPAFFSISEYSFDLADPSHIRLLGGPHKNQQGNAAALLLSGQMLLHFLKNSLQISDKDYCEPDDSETDEEDNGCTIM